MSFLKQSNPKSNNSNQGNYRSVKVPNQLPQQIQTSNHADISPKFFQLPSKSNESYHDNGDMQYVENSTLYGGKIPNIGKFPNNQPILPFDGMSLFPQYESTKREMEQEKQKMNKKNNKQGKSVIEEVESIIKEQEKKEEEEKKKNEKEAEIWDGPELYESGFYRNNKTTKEIKEIIILKLIELSKNCLDYNINEQNIFEIDGRIFDNLNGEMSEFKITIWKYFKFNYQSIVHFKKQSGDGFLFCNLQDQIIHFLQSQQLQLDEPEQQDEEIIIDPFAFNFNFDLDIDGNSNGGGSGGNDMGSPLSDSFNSNSTFNKLDYNFDLVIDDVDNENENNNDNNQEQYLKNIVEDICNENNYMENIQTSTCLLLKLNDNEINLIFQIYGFYTIIDKLLNCIQNQFDVQQIRNVLQICERLLTNNEFKQQQNVKQDQNIKYTIKNIQQKWENGASRNIGNRTIKFGQSQQIVQSCSNCLQTLEQM